MSALVPILAVIPGLAFTWRLRRAPDAERDGIWWGFGLGVVGLLLVLVPGTALLGPTPLAAASPFERAFLLAALPEESAKLVLLAFLLSRARPRSAIFRLSVAVSLGFATGESIVFAARGGVQGAFIHSLLAVPAHAAFGALTGRILLDRPRTSSLLLAWVAAVLAHGLYDWPLFHLAGSTDASRMIWLASWAAFYSVGIRWTWKTIRRLESPKAADAPTAIPEPAPLPRSVPPTRTPRPSLRAPRS